MAFSRAVFNPVAGRSPARSGGWRGLAVAASRIRARACNRSAFDEARRQRARSTLFTLAVSLPLCLGAVFAVSDSAHADVLVSNLGQMNHPLTVGDTETGDLVS